MKDLAAFFRELTETPTGAFVDHEASIARLSVIIGRARELVDGDERDLGRVEEAEALAGEAIMIAVSACCESTMTCAVAVSCALKSVVGYHEDDFAKYKLWSTRAAIHASRGGLEL